MGGCRPPTTRAPVPSPSPRVAGRRTTSTSSTRGFGVGVDRASSPAVVPHGRMPGRRHPDLRPPPGPPQHGRHRRARPLLRHPAHLRRPWTPAPTTSSAGRSPPRRCPDVRPRRAPPGRGRAVGVRGCGWSCSCSRPGSPSSSSPPSTPGPRCRGWTPSPRGTVLRRARAAPTCSWARTAGRASARRTARGSARAARRDVAPTRSSSSTSLPGGGKPALISIPRDSYLEIPGEGRNKVNAAFAIGGPALLVATLEDATGLRIDGYVEIGFGGFASVVDSLGGVEMCLPKALADEKAHIDLPAGCQTLDGANALGYVRARYSDPRGDLGRAERQTTVPRCGDAPGRHPVHGAHSHPVVAVHALRGGGRARRRGHLRRRRGPHPVDDAQGVVGRGPQSRRPRSRPRTPRRRREAPSCGTTSGREPCSRCSARALPSRYRRRAPTASRPAGDGRRARRSVGVLAALGTAARAVACEGSRWAPLHSSPERGPVITAAQGLEERV